MQIASPGEFFCLLSSVGQCSLHLCSHARCRHVTRLNFLPRLSKPRCDTSAPLCNFCYRSQDLALTPNRMVLIRSRCGTRVCKKRLFRKLLVFGHLCSIASDCSLHSTNDCSTNRRDSITQIRGSLQTQSRELSPISPDAASDSQLDTRRLASQRLQYARSTFTKRSHRRLHARSSNSISEQVDTMNGVRPPFLSDQKMRELCDVPGAKA